MDDEPRGGLIYGYGKDEALRLKDTLESLIERPVEILSATNREGLVVGDILDQEESGNTYQDSPVKFLMFLGFLDPEINAVMSGLPKDDRRPIFCGLTESNVAWPVAKLIEHLLEEKRYWADRKPGDR